MTRKKTDDHKDITWRLNAELAYLDEYPEIDSKITGHDLERSEEAMDFYKKHKVYTAKNYLRKKKSSTPKKRKIAKKTKGCGCK